MPINPLSKLLDRRKPLRPDAEQALSQLTQLGERYPDLAAVAATHAALIRVAFRDAPPVPAVALDAAHAAAKLQAGVPLLRGEQLGLDAAWLRERYQHLCQSLLDLPKSGNDGALARSAVQALQQAVKRGTLDIHSAAIDILTGDPYAIAVRAERLDLNPELAATLVRWTLLPVLEHVAKQLEPLRQNQIWEKGYCPCCGSWPLLGERRGLERTLFLRCGLCASSWQVDNIFCPFCNSRTHFDIGYLYDEAQEPNQRAVTCERCHSYYKSVTTLAAIPTPQLFVTDLETLHLDLIALERAYGPPS